MSSDNATDIQMEDGEAIEVNFNSQVLRIEANQEDGALKLVPQAGGEIHVNAAGHITFS